MKRAIVAPLSLACTLACAPGSSGEDTSTGIPTTTATTTTGGETGEAEPFEPVPARGVRITGVTANHGINVSIASGTEWVGPNGREGRLVAGRDTLIRVYHELDPDWVEHEVEARLELTLPGGEVQNYSSSKVLVTDTNDSYLDGGLWFAVPADSGATEPGTVFQVSLWDVSPGGEGLTEHPSVSPADGPGQIGFESIPMEMNVHYIPFTYNGVTPDFTDGKLDTVTDEIFQMQPVQRVNATTGSPRNWGGGPNVCTMLETMLQIWSSEGAPSNVYYVGMLDTGASSGIMGCAWLDSQVNADVWVEGNISTTATSVVHEIGHNQGLNHVECDDMGNPSADNDPSYPDHPDGRTLNTGFGIRNFQTFPGDETIDYMSYCNKRWVSPWTWDKIWGRIQQKTAQGSPDMVPDPDPVIHFALYGDGSESWFTALSRRDTSDIAEAGYVEFIADGETIAREGAHLDVLSDDQSIIVTAQMPNDDPEAEFDTIRFVDFATEAVHEASRESVKFYTQLDELGPQ